MWETWLEMHEPGTRRSLREWLVVGENEILMTGNEQEHVPVQKNNGTSF
jgi:hypothetical protein